MSLPQGRFRTRFGTAAWASLGIAYLVNAYRGWKDNEVTHEILWNTMKPTMKKQMHPSKMMMKCSDSHLVNVNKSKDFAILNLRYNPHTPDEFYTVKKGQCSLLDT